MKDFNKKHPDRLISFNKKYKNAQNKIKWMVKEAVKKGYTILSADFYKKDGKIMRGMVMFKQFEGFELAYNPTWESDLNIKIDVNIPFFSDKPTEGNE